jgi:hypothetical protein
MKSMSQAIIILGTFHQLQGRNFTGHVDDPSCRALIQTLIKTNNVDFIFEEASGRGPSIAEELANRVGADRYQDIDPDRNERSRYGIAEETEISIPVDLWSHPPEFYSEQKLQDHQKREDLWITRLQRRHFTTALMICGIAHCLSVSFRLQGAGYAVKAFNYIPHHKVCKHA